MKCIKLFEEFLNKPEKINMTPLAKYYAGHNTNVIKIAAEIDEIINSANFIEDSSRNRMLDLITDLTDEFGKRP